MTEDYHHHHHHCPHLLTNRRTQQVTTRLQLLHRTFIISIFIILHVLGLNWNKIIQLNHNLAGYPYENGSPVKWLPFGLTLTSSLSAAIWQSNDSQFTAFSKNCTLLFDCNELKVLQQLSCSYLAADFMLLNDYSLASQAVNKILIFCTLPSSFFN